MLRYCKSLRFVSLTIAFLLAAYSPAMAATSEPASEPATQGAAASEPAAKGKLEALGLLDVTSAAFGADPSGKADSTAAIRKAIAAAHKRHMTIYFPGGTYTVSDTLEYMFDVAKQKKGQDNPCQMLGERGGAKRARIVLAPQSPGFDKPDSPKPIVHIWGNRDQPPKAQPNISYNNVFLNIDVEIGAGNPGAIGIHHDAAQGSGIEDVTVEAGDGYAGIFGLQAGGGGEHNIKIVGGRIGLDASKSRATAAVVSGATFIGQKESAILYGSWETLCLVGARIEVPAGAKGPAIQGVATGPTNGTMSIVDTEIRFETASPENVAIGSNRSVYLNNVWVRNGGKIVSTTDGGTLEGNADGWRQIVEFAHAMRPPLLANKWNVQFEHVNYLNGKRQTEDVVEKGEDGKEPPADLQSRHLWTECPAWESPTTINVKSAPYNAKGDGKTDDTEALQRAINENETVFFPQGIYRVTKTLELGAHSKLVGLRHNSVVKAMYLEGGSFTDPKNPQPIKRTVDDANADTVVAYLGLSWDQDHPGTCGMLEWRAGRNSVVRSLYVGVSKHENYLTKITGHGGGRWYSLFKLARMTIEGTTEPLRFYQCNPEWGARPHVLVKNAKDVTFYAFKNEGSNAMTCLDSDDINVFSYGGVANAPKGKALFNIERTPHFRLTGLLDRGLIEGTNPKEWWMVNETPAEGAPTIHTEPLDRPILYRRQPGQ